MSLKFAIIPYNTDLISVAYDIKTKLKNELKFPINVIIDSNFDNKINRRTNKLIRQSYNIVIIDLEYYENNTISFKLSEVGSEIQILYIDELVDLIASYNDEEEDNTDNTDNDNNDNNNNEGCLFM